MKNVIKFLTILICLNFIPTISMEKNDLVSSKDQPSPLELVICDLANELWLQIIIYSYVNFEDLDISKDIYEGLDCVKKNWPDISKNIRLVCKTFNSLNGSIDIKKLKQLFIKKFLKLNFDHTAYYPRNGEWGFYGEESVAKFLTSGKENAPISAIIFLLQENQASSFLKILQLLLFCGADINALDKFGHSALFNAVLRYGNDHWIKHNIKSLLSHGSDINIRYENGDTILHMAMKWHACGTNDTEIITMLLDAGCDAKLPNDAGETPLTLAQMRPCIHKIDELMKASCGISEQNTRCVLS